METEKRREFIKDQIYHSVRHDILTFQYLPGEKLSENRIATKYSVSRSPVRAVLQKLENEKLVIIDPQRGTFVTKLDYHYIQNIIYMRWCVESNLLRTIADKQPRPLLEELRHCLYQQKELLQAEKIDPEEFTVLDNEFHRLCYAGNDREPLWQLLQEVNANYLRFRLLDLVAGNAHRQIYLDHCRILQAIEDQDVQLLDRLSKQHLYGNLQTFEGVKSEYRAYFIS